MTLYGYDANGNQSTVTDALGRVTTHNFDARDRLIEVIDPLNLTAAKTKYEYNGRDQLTKVTDPNALSTTYTANGYGEVVSQTSPDTGLTTFTYDAASNMKTKRDARDILSSFTYDELNRVVQVTYPDEIITYAYDTCTNGKGRLCKVTDKTGSTTYVYDLWGRIVQKTQDMTVGGVTSHAIGYLYSALGQLTRMTLPSGRQVDYTYVNGRPVSVKVNGVAVLDAAVYEPFGPVGGWRWGNSTSSAPNFHTRVFDRDFRPTRITSDLPGGLNGVDWTVGWHDVGRVGTIGNLMNTQLNATYGYDLLDRLTSASQSTGSWTYSYDGNGNRSTRVANGATTTYQYSAGTNRLSASAGAQALTYQSDAAGNLFSDGTRTWAYGGNNRQTQVTVGGVTTTFAVNALGQRVRKATGAASATRFVYDEGGKLLGEYSDSGSPISETLWFGDIPVAVLR